MSIRQAKSSNRLRVGFVMHKMQVAGAEVLVQQIIRQLRETIDSTVLCLDGLGEIGQQLVDDGVPVVVLGRKEGVDWPLARRLADEVKHRHIEMLHAHQYTPFFYSAIARLRHGVRAKVLFTEHGRHYPDVVSWKRRWANRLLLSRFADTITACCDFSTESLRHNDGFLQAQTLRNGVNLCDLPMRSDEEKHALRERLGLHIDRPYAACIARFHPVKDHATLVRSWKHVLDKVPAARLLLVGDGPARSGIESLAHELGVADSIEFWGIRSDVADILRAVDVFTLTSVSEAASLTLLEAMASGCASVITDVGGNGEHVTDGVEGHLIPRGDSEQLGVRLSELLADAELTSQLGVAARARVEKCFDLNQVIAKYANLYAKLSGRQFTPETVPCSSSKRGFVREPASAGGAT